MLSAKNRQHLWIGRWANAIYHMIRVAGFPNDRLMASRRGGPRLCRCPNRKLVVTNQPPYDRHCVAWYALGRT